MSTLMGQLQARIETAVNKTGTYNEALQNLADAFGVPPSETGSRLIPVVKVFDPTIDNATAAQNYLLYNSTIVSGGVPAMAMDFTSGTLDSRVTFTRASTATRVNANGLIESVAIDGPRFDYDPVSRAPKGLLIEEQRTNLLLQSDAYGTSPWTTDSGATTVTADATTAPNGLTTADLVLDGTTTNDHPRYQACTITASTTYTYSAFYKDLDRRYIRHSFSTSASVNSIYADVDLQAGVIVNSGQIGTGTIVSASITPFGNGWYRVSVTGNLGANTASFPNFFLRDSATNVTTEAEMSYTGSNKGVYAWGAQLEAGSFATSYIPTVAAQVTRSADNASMIGDNFANWYNATEGSFFAEFQTLFSSAADISRGLLGGDASSSKRYFYISQASDYISSFDGAVVASTSADITGPIAKACSAYNATNRFICSQGGAVQTTTVAAGYPATTSIQIGVYGASTNIFCGHIRRIMYYNTKLPDAQLQALTS